MDAERKRPARWATRKGRDYERVAPCQVTKRRKEVFLTTASAMAHQQSFSFAAFTPAGCRSGPDGVSPHRLFDSLSRAAAPFAPCLRDPRLRCQQRFLIDGWFVQPVGRDSVEPISTSKGRGSTFPMPPSFNRMAPAKAPALEGRCRPDQAQGRSIARLPLRFLFLGLSGAPGGASCGAGFLRSGMRS